MFLWMNVFTLCIWLACDSQRHERLQRIRYWFTSNHIPFRFGCRPREASRLEAKTHEAEAKPHEAEAEAEATTHEAEAEAEARFFGLEAEARPRGLTSLPPIFQTSRRLCVQHAGRTDRPPPMRQGQRLNRKSKQENGNDIGTMHIKSRVRHSLE